MTMATVLIDLGHRVTVSDVWLVDVVFAVVLVFVGVSIGPHVVLVLVARVVGLVSLVTGVLFFFAELLDVVWNLAGAKVSVAAVSDL